MTTDIIGVTFIFLAAIALAIPLGKYISKVYKGEKSLLDFLRPVENLFFKISGINPDEEMDWKQNVKALMTINFVWFVMGVIILVTQTIHPFGNPDNIPGMEPTQAFNTAISFLTNTNLQHYSGETGASYFSQLIFLMFMQFVSAGTGMAAMALLFKGLSNKSGKDLGN
ncbi:MAG: potassium-transporting ATPase subunit KdpA, partial [bacterium]